ncbi:hypothetical protein FDI69_gp182 [Rhodococcus phage Trina]|uniref:Uncharacterized protein n=1 Tax=Rhodococcus phage Trina TaxID=2027905 RepID=A0A2D1ADW5_9CAUD|nr:hypothetical protein FDI69_gp182 [Rhodococcus phage Trina]ASZ75004.1 hypothetical protein SEA_TRINA_225 [Rhodococcus phage Trina]
MSDTVVVAVIGVVSTIAAGGLLEIVKKSLSKAKDKTDADSGLRSELRQDLETKRDELLALKKELKELEIESDKWRQDYWTLYALFFQLKLIATKLTQNDPELKQQIENILAPHERMQREVESNE